MHEYSTSLSDHHAHLLENYTRIIFSSYIRELFLYLIALSALELLLADIICIDICIVKLISFLCFLLHFNLIQPFLGCKLTMPGSGTLQHATWLCICYWPDIKQYSCIVWCQERANEHWCPAVLTKHPQLCIDLTVLLHTELYNIFESLASRHAKHVV